MMRHFTSQKIFAKVNLLQSHGLKSHGLKNHIGRKTMMQTLLNNEIPPTDIIQLSGHKNLQSVTNYSTVSENQQKKMSQALSCLSTQEIVSKNKNFIEESAEFKQSQHSHEDLQQGSQQVLSLLSGATI